MSTSAQLVTIVPRLRPAIDGVGDYALEIAQALHHRGVRSQFIVGDSQWQGDKLLAGMPAQRVSQRSSTALLTQLAQAKTILLHYVPHGYAAKACPFWLIQALEQWRRNSDTFLLTMFHELYACDWQRPWSSDFWLSPVQRQLASRLAQLSDVCLTSSQRYADQLNPLSHGKHTQVTALPVFSNVGELAQVLPLVQRQPHLVIFGQRHSKEKIYQQALAKLKQVCQQLAITQIWDIGVPVPQMPTQVGHAPITALGKLANDAIAHYLSQSQAGFLAYDPKRLGKSGIFAAYCAYGVLPINHQAANFPVEGLTAGIQYWVPTPNDSSKDVLAQVQLIATSAHTWYQTHTVARQAQVFQDLLPISLLKNVSHVCDSIS